MGKPKDMRAAQCQLCGKRFSRAGLAGHMAWKHGRDPKAPMMPVTTRPYIVELRERAYRGVVTSWQGRSGKGAFGAAKRE